MAARRTVSARQMYDAVGRDTQLTKAEWLRSVEYAFRIEEPQIGSLVGVDAVPTAAAPENVMIWQRVFDERGQAWVRLDDHGSYSSWEEIMSYGAPYELVKKVEE